MKKLLYATFVWLLICQTASAQYKLSAGTMPDGLEFIQADKTGDAMRIYLRWTSAEDNYGFDIDDDACVTVPGSFKRYKLQAASNIPLTSDGAYAVARKAGDSIWFALDFEAFPTDGSFSIIEDAENDSCLSISDIKLTDAGLPLINTEKFVSDHPSLLKGQFSEDGTVYSFWNYDGLALVANFVKTTDNTHLFYIYLDIANNSGRSVDLDPSAISVEHESKSGHRSALKVFDAKGYEKRMKTENFFNKTMMVASAIATVESIGNTLSGGQFFSTSTVSGDATRGYISFMNSQDNVKKFTQMMGSVSKEYLEERTIESRDWYGGYLCLNEKKGGLYQITVPLMGQDFTFTVEE